jgi:hypothetical protein
VEELELEEEESQKLKDRQKIKGHNVFTNQQEAL